MRFLTLGMTAATAAFLMTGGIASAQTKAAPEKAQGAGAACARSTAPGSRDECVHEQKNGASSSTRGNSSGSSGSSDSNSSIGSGNNTSINGQSNAPSRQDNSRGGSNAQGNMPSSSSGSSGMSGSSDRGKR